MRFSSVDHIGIAVADYDAAVETYTKLHGAPPASEVVVESEQVRVAFFPSGDTQTELLAPLGDAGPIAKFLEKRGPGLHHICYAVDDLAAAQEALASQGFTPIHPQPRIGAEGKPVLFFHPKHTGGVLVEITTSSQNETTVAKSRID